MVIRDKADNHIETGPLTETSRCIALQRDRRDGQTGLPDLQTDANRQLKAAEPLSGCAVM